MAANKLCLSSSTLGLLIAVLFTLCALPLFSTAQSTASPALPSDAGTPSSGDVASAGPGSTEPAAATTSLPPPSAATTTAPKKFPEYVPRPGGGYLPGVGGTYLPGPDVASALPVPTPDELPSADGLGFGGHDYECCGGGGYGWFGGPGGFGPGTYGYNGPLYFGAAPPARNVLLPLVVACVSAALYCI